MPTSDGRPGRGAQLLLGAIAGLGGFLRFQSLGWGLPGLFEEATPFRKAVEFWGAESGRIHFDPAFYHYPSLTFYLHFVVQALAGLVGLLLGRWHSLNEFRAALSADPTPFALAGRTVSVLLGVVTIGIVWRTARRLGGTAAAGVAAGLLAVCPSHIAESRSIGTDVPMAMALAVALDRLVAAARTDAPRALRPVAVWLGLAASCKYPAGLLLLPLLLLAVRPGPFGGTTRRARDLPVALSLGLLAFGLTSPWVLLNLPDAWRAVAFERFHMASGHFGGAGSRAFGRYALDLLPHALGWPGLIVAIAAVVLALGRRGPERLLAISVAAGIVLLGSWRVAFDRYALLILPPLAVLAGWGVALTARRIGGRASLVVLVTAGVAVVFPGLVTSLREAEVRGRPTTRQAAMTWLCGRVNRTTLLAAENYSVESMADSLPLLVIPFDSVQPHLYDPAYSLPFYAPFEYVVVSSALYDRYMNRPGDFPAQVAFYEGLSQRWVSTAVFEPERGRVGPTIRIYRRPEGVALPDLRSIAPSFYDRLPAPGPMASFLTSLAGVLLRGGRADLALPAAERAVALAPDDVHALSNLAVLQARRGDYLSALKSYERALTLRPDDPVLHYNQGRLYQGHELYNDAVAAYQRALHYNPRMTEAWRGTAASLLRMGNTPAARRALEKLLDVTPPGPEAEEVRGMIRDLGGSAP